MAANFDRWEKDPFFSAAEEVQESADRMESTYRTWLHSMKDTSSVWNREDLRRDLCTSLDTTKWQLEEFQRAVQSSYKNNDADEAKDRHHQFVIAMEGKISLIQKSLQESITSDANSSSPWVQLDEGERDELALFLSGPKTSGDRAEDGIRGMYEKATNPPTLDEPSASNCLRCTCHPSVQNAVEVKDEKLSGHRRTASAGADIASWNITIGEDELASHSSNGVVEVLPRRVPSFSAFIGTMEPVSKFKLLKNGFRKWKPTVRQQEDEVVLLRSQPQIRGIHACYERNRSCLDNCEDCYDKQLYDWHGAVHRLLQRSLYQVQYIRSMQITYWVALLLFSIVIFLVRIL